MSAPLAYRITARTDVGLVRDHNEDNFIVCPDLGEDDWRFDDSRDYRPEEKGAVWVVADGMGGTNAGEVASSIAVEHVKKTFNDLRAAGLPPSQASADLLDRTMRAADQAIAEHARKDPSSQGMGTTAVLGWLRGARLHVCWVGDSRAYLMRKGRLRRISRDHSLVQQLVDAGTITEEQAFHHPQSNIILQSLGEGKNDLEPGHAEVVLQKDDLVMLCTDGLNGMVNDADMEAIIHAGGELDAISSRLVEAAKAGGGHDNITVVLARVDEAPEPDPEVLPYSEATAAPSGPAARPMGAQATVPTAPGSRTPKVLLIGVALVLALIAGYFLGGYGQSPDADASDSTVVQHPRMPAEPDGGTKEDGTAKPGASKGLKETPVQGEPSHDQPVRDSVAPLREVPPRTRPSDTRSAPAPRRDSVDARSDTDREGLVVPDDAMRKPDDN